MNVQPLLPEKIPAAQLTVNNLICAHQSALASRVQGENCTVSLAPLVARQQHTPELTVVLGIDGNQCSVQLNKAVFSGIKLGDVVVADVIDTLPEAVRRGVVLLVFERILTDLKALIQKDIEVVSVLPDTAALSPALPVSFVMPGCTASGLLEVTGAVQNLLQELPPAQPADACSSVPVPVCIEAGRTMLDTKQLSDLATQDIILFSHSWHADRTGVLIRTGTHTGFMATLLEQQVTLKGKTEVPVGDTLDDDEDDFDDFDDDFDDDDENTPQADADTTAEAAQTEPPAADTTATATNQAGNTDVSAIPVLLTFDIGQQEMTVGDMAKMVPGYTFQLTRPLASPVMIKANGKSLAEGELVDINGQLGTRILKML